MEYDMSKMWMKTVGKNMQEIWNKLCAYIENTIWKKI